MKIESREIQDDKFAAIGIGAMIVFIALILVAAVAAAVIIQTAEKLQQNAQTTGEDTSNNLAGKLVIHAAFVSTGGTGAPGAYPPQEAYVLYVRLAPGSSAITISDITFQIMCTNGVVEGTLGTAGEADIALLDQGSQGLLAGTAALQPGQPYVLWVDGNMNGADCSPDNGVDTTVQLYFHVGVGGSTYEELTIRNTAAGSPVV